jgi:photosystem II stability/assembly factor-like uncharacterized protein
MRFWSALLVSLAGAGICLWPQDQPPAAPPATAAGQSPAGAEAPPPEAPLPPVLVNLGKPMVLPFQCTREDIQAAGFTCSEEAPCPVYLELSAAASTGSKYYLGGNIHSDAVTLYAILLGSEDAGHTWREINPRIRGAGIDHLQFLDSVTGWAGGQQLFPLPQEPFVLLTTDGGKTWRQQPIFGESAESHFGSLQQMFFSSRTAGSVIIDRSQGGDAGPFALYETSDGGETWTIKQQSKQPLEIKGAPAVSADWRLRVDAATKAFLAEHRQGERWNSGAAFSVDIAACKLPAQ